ncbi:DNA polymerase III subunit delta [Candidatus Tenderia electrophaga]|jgi:DNA polymerase-3 subunit delta|uniref:DNA polymerase III subunit delta n=1 Tax=Candidatus Tenderia electrophaga TaxID=1748243 RepID=A0A0S2TA71_9GAMM|nr:DNA polymerase III subunit delta [Candidatus Tenderia electrophaga]
MQIKPEQLNAQLKRGLASIYFVSGDEALLVQEACDAIRAAARQAGCSEREVHHVEGGFDWQGFVQSGDAMSLFAERKLIELRLPTGKPGDAGSKALQAYAARPSEDNILLIISGKLEANARKSKWYKALDQAGALVTIWPMDLKQLPGWAMRRMQDKGLQPSQEAVALLVERVEGNLLACAQEIEKLLLLHGPGPIDIDQVAAGVTDSSRFDIYKLVDAALQGDPVRTTRIINGLRGEGVEPVLVLWALSREIRAMAGMAFEISRGERGEQVLAKHRVWEKRKPLVRAGLKRHSLAQWQDMLERCAEIDAMIKRGRAGNVWDEFLALSVCLGGAELFRRVGHAV